MKHKRRTITLMLLLTLLLSVSGTMAQDPQPAGEVSITAVVESKFSYQGLLKEGGNPVTGSRHMTFRLYADAACTSQVGSDIDMPAVPVAGGLFSVALEVAPGDVSGQALWLEVAAAGTPVVCHEIVPVPYALSLRPGATISGEGSTSLLVRNTSTNTGANAIQGSASGQSGQIYGVVSLSDSPNGRGVLGHAMATSGTAYGVAGRTDSSGDYAAGVRGHAAAASGQTFGVIGRTDSSTDWATGVQGHTSAASGQTYGVRGYSASTSGRGVAGHASATSGVTFGVYGQTDSTNDEAAGVRGHATATSGSTYGVWGRNESPLGSGVYGEGCFGVYGRTDSDHRSYAGVQGVASDADGEAVGVRGVALGDGGRAVLGEKTGISGIAVAGENLGGGSGTYGYSAEWVGVWGATGAVTQNYGFYTPDNLYSANIHLTGATMVVAQNGGDSPLEAGEVVRFSGIAGGDTANAIPLPQVSAATKQDDRAVAGVVFSGYDWETVRRWTPNGHDPMYGHESTLEGPVDPGEYLLVVVQGPAQVKASALSGPIRPGDLLSTADRAGFAARATEVEVCGTKMAVPGSVFGKSLEALDEGQGLTWAFVALH